MSSLSPERSLPAKSIPPAQPGNPEATNRCISSYQMPHDLMAAWVESSMNPAAESDRAPIRQKMVAVLQSMADVVKETGGSVFATYTRLSHVLTLEPKTVDLLKSVSPSFANVSLSPSVPLREAASVYDLIRQTTSAAGLEPIPQISVDLTAWAARLENALTIKASEDCLDSLRIVTWFDNFQEEYMRKEAAHRENLVYLRRRNPRTVSSQNLHAMYQHLIHMVYPAASEIIPTILTHELSIDGSLEMSRDILNPKLIPYIKVRPPPNIRWLDGFLTKYNRAIIDQKSIKTKTTRDHAEFLAEMYAIYLAIHPHFDANASMARVLIDNYLETYGLNPISWLGVIRNLDLRSKLSDCLGDWWFDDEKPLIDWFARQLSQQQ
jgi:hypothetical protein